MEIGEDERCHGLAADPAVRRLLKVQIEDTITSDNIFTTLMGEQVEPRRDFIEMNALGVRNLDV